MDFGFLMAANSITTKYLNQNSVNNINPGLSAVDLENQDKFDEKFKEAYDSLIATKALQENMAKSYEAGHKDFYEHATRLGYSIDNRVIDMLHVKLSDDMNSKVNSAINSTEL